MITSRWLDHLPPWLAWGAIATTGAYSWNEVGGMAIPLVAALVVERRNTSLFRYRRVLELIALAVFLFLVVARAGVLPTVLNTLFTLCGVRLCLPREMPQRRQLLLMGFLLFLTTAVSTSELDFLLWSVLWLAGAVLFLLQANWEKSALLRPGPLQPPPLRKVPLWTAAAVVMAAGFFVVLPRLRLGVRSLPLGVQSMAGVPAGLSGVLDLSGKGPILGSSEVAARIIPEVRSPGFDKSFSFLRGVVLEELDGLRWETSPGTPRRSTVEWTGPADRSRAYRAEVCLSPNPLAVIPLPYGNADLEPPQGEMLRSGQGGSVRWAFPLRRVLSIGLAMTPRDTEPEAPPTGERARFLVRAGAESDAALRWSRRAVPGDEAPGVLAERLSQRLRTFRYTLENPSGGTANPMEDFLERTRAGHCEYFASALAIMLRRRGVPARVVNGYRLGPWIQEGGYFLVTQNEAHSWVEFFDPDARGWRAVDPTPSAPPSAMASGSFGAGLARLADAMRFRWDRYVVRFSDEDQVAGLDWAGATFDRLRGRRGPGPKAALGTLAALATLAVLVRWARRGLPFPGQGQPGSPGRIAELRPLIRAVGKEAPPLPGETVSRWLERLGQLRPQRTQALAALAREADAVAYGGKGSTALARLAKAEAKQWRKRA